MLSSLVLLAVSLLPGVFGGAAEDPNAPPELIERQGGGGGYYYSFWQEGGGNFRCQNGAAGSYSVTWSGNGGFVCGKGWSPGGNRAVNYAGTYEPKGPGYLALYGWTRNPLIEYYIMDAHGDLAPNEPWTSKGNFTFEEGTYEVYTSQRVNKPSIVGTATFTQYWSVRTEQRIGGTISTGRHFEEWAKLGMRLGGHDYMIMATEGYTSGANSSSGMAAITVT